MLFYPHPQNEVAEKHYKARGTQQAPNKDNLFRCLLHARVPSPWGWGLWVSYCFNPQCLTQILPFRSYSIDIRTQHSLNKYWKWTTDVSRWHDIYLSHKFTPLFTRMYTDNIATVLSTTVFPGLHPSCNISKVCLQLVVSLLDAPSPCPCSSFPQQIFMN